MKTLQKLTAFLLALFLVVGMLPPAAHAAENESIDLNVTYINPVYADVVSEADLLPWSPSPIATLSEPVYVTTVEEAGEILREQMKERIESAVVYIQTDKADNTYLEELSYAISDAAVAHTGNPVEGDYLKWQYAGFDASITGSGSGGLYDLCYSYTLTYYTTAEQEAEMDEAVDALLDELDVDDASDYKKIKAIYDYICANVAYDHEHKDDSTYTPMFTAYAALINGTAVCQGYANLLYRLALELGVDARLIPGDGGGPHGWNIVELKGQYYNVDSTWDTGKTEYDYFLKCEANFSNHVRYDEWNTESFHAEYPMASADYVPSAADLCTHNYEGTADPAATCTENGTMVYTCSNCGDSYSETIPAVGHSYTSMVTAPTCTEDGYTTYTCSCGDTYTDDSVDALGHSWDDGVVTKEATEEETGIRTYTCTVCDEIKTEDIPTLEHTHSYTAVVTAPTCTEDGYTTYTCSCGDTYTDDPVDALGHSWDDGVVTKEATEDETGIRTYTCTVCGAAKEEEIPCEAPSVNVTRVSGDTRYETSFAIAAQLKEVLGIETFDTIIVASGESYPDALSGSYLSTMKNAPILLTNKSMNSTVLDYINENLSTGGMVYILGGVNSVSQSFEDSLDEAGIQNKRLSGNTRVETNLAILEEAQVNGDKILISTAYNYADSLSASASGLPVLLLDTNANKLTDAQKDFLEAHSGCEFYILGGVNTVSEKLTEAVGAYGTVQRVSGDTREATSVAVASFVENPECVVLAYSRNYPDGLCGGVLAYNLKAPVILTNSGMEDLAAEYVKENSISKGVILGGPNSVTESSVDLIFAAAEEDDEETPTIDTSASYAVPEVVDIVNEYRAEEGLEPLSYYSEGQEVANIRAAEIRVNFSHTRPDGTDSYDYTSQYGLYGECITGGANNAQDVVDGWMSSDAHRSQIMADFFTYAVAARNGAGWVILLG